MEISFHPATQRDVNEIVDHYRSEIGQMLVNRFFEALESRLDDISEHPERFAFYLGHRFLRRAKLDHFPHLIVFRILRDRVRVTIIKHAKRHPAYGIGRR